MIAWIKALFMRAPAPAPEVFLYTKPGTSEQGGVTTLRGVLVAITRSYYELDIARVCWDGSNTFKPLRGRVRIPAANVDFYTLA